MATGKNVPVSYTDAKYEWLDETFITADAYDTRYYKYTCIDCGETMTGYVKGTYEGESDPIVLHNYKMKVIKFTDSGRIKNGIEGLIEDPPRGDIKMMQGCSNNERRLRIGKYRIIYNYQILDNVRTLCIINVDSRGDIYK